MTLPLLYPLHLISELVGRVTQMSLTSDGAGGASDLMSSASTSPTMCTFLASRNLVFWWSFIHGFEEDGETEGLVYFGEGS
jgi:hypothetical protein